MLRLFTCTLLVFLLAILPAVATAEASAVANIMSIGTMTADLAQEPVVRAVMFWSKGCGHCQKVMTEVLPPLQQKYGSKLEIHLIEISDAQSLDRLDRAAAAMGLKPNEVGVPMLIIGDRVLLGSLQIPMELPGLIEKYLAQGGVDYPQIPGLENLSQRATRAGASQENGFALAWVVMIILILALAYALFAVIRHFSGRSLPTGPAWLEMAIPFLCILGLLVALYLSFVETTATQAICGPVGDCNAVQSSAYARLFGILPVGVLGALGYIALLAAWLWRRLRNDVLAVYAPLAILAMALFGVVFSMYLTYLELYVIKAVCAWCLASAVTMALLLVLSVSPALQSVSTTE